MSNIILKQGDCLELMKELPDESVDLIITSPPYNLRNYKGYIFNFKAIAKELFRVTKNGGVVVWIVGDATINGPKLELLLSKPYFLKKLVLTCMTP